MSKRKSAGRDFASLLIAGLQRVK